uniref:E3 ubiquitin-protein ligase ZNRF1 n=1 Tax=Magallana gigas TaxID=29159 RepID=A0A8W8K3V6_MAGGI
MGTKQSTPSQRPRTFSGSGPVPGGSGADVAVGSSGASNTRLRARSLGHFSASTPTGLVIPPGATANGDRRGTRSPDSDSSTPEEGPSFGRQFAHSLPLHLFALQEDVLVEDKGECVICFEELEKGDTIARLPCLCVYHKGCIDKWFEKNRSCPEHPSD